MARPTKLTPEIVEAAKAYLENYEAAGDLFPNIAGLAVAIKLSRSTIYDWSRQEGSEFSHIVDDILAKQEQMLWLGGMKEGWNASLTKLALTKHGYSDKQTLEGDPDKPIAVNAKVEIEFV